MKSIAQAVVIAAALAAPLASHAQVSQPLTRAEVRANLLDVEQAGYRPSPGLDVNYPNDAQAAERKLAEQRAAGAKETGFGGDAVGTSQAGVRGDEAVSSYSPPIRVAR